MHPSYNYQTKSRPNYPCGGPGFQIDFSEQLLAAQSVIGLESESYTIFIGCLHGKTTEDIVETYFSQFGPVFNISLKKKGQAGNAGFGTFTIYGNEQFNRIIARDHYLLNRKIICRQFFHGKQKETFLKDLNQRRIFIRNLPVYISDLDLRSLFQVYGSVNKAYAIRDEFGESKGFGYVCFEEKSQASYIVSLRRI